MDEVVDVLLRPWSRRPPTWEGEGRVLFLGARHHPALYELIGARLLAVQPFAPWATQLLALGFDVMPEVPDGLSCSAALVLPERQRDAGLAQIGRAWLSLADDGELLLAAPVREGGKRWIEDLRRLAGGVRSDSKARCRVGMASKRGSAGEDLARTWVEAGAPRKDEHGLWTRPGVFAWEGIDAGTAALLAALPPLEGKVVDLGAGRGVLADGVLRSSPGVTELHLLEADGLALALATRSLAERHPGRAVHAHHLDARVRWPVEGVDVVVTNPPFHEGGRADPGLAQEMLRAASQALRPGGVCWIVANVHLPYERTLTEAFHSWRFVVTEGPYKVIEAKKA